MNIFVIDKIEKKNIGIIDFIPHREERIILKNGWNNFECKVNCVVYNPREHAVLVFVDIVEPYYSLMVSDIKWK